MSQLRDALDDLASDVPPPAPPGDLWRQGRRRVRNRRLTGLAAALLLAAAGGSLPTVVDRAAPPPVAVPAESELAVPLRLHAVPGHLAGSRDLGAPGRIAALWRVVDGRSGWFGSDAAWVAVSAVDGSYRWLDEVPGDAEALLSPDGRRVFWPETGLVDGWPSDVQTGYAVYDAQTGRTLRHDLLERSRYGTDSEEVAWSPDSTRLLVLRCENLPAGAEVGYGCRDDGVDALDAATGEVDETFPDLDGAFVGHSAGSLLLAADGGRGTVAAVDPGTGQTRRVGTARLGGLHLKEVVLQQSSQHLVLGIDNTVNRPILPAVGTMRLDGSRPEVERLKQYTTAEPVGPIAMNDEETGLAFVEYLAPGGSERRTTRVTVKAFWPGHGVVTVLDTGQGFRGTELQLAADLVADDRFTDEAPLPEQSWTRWRWPGVLAGAGLAGLVAVLVRVRRTRGAG